MADQAQGITSGAEDVTRRAVGGVRSGEDEAREVEREEEHPGGGKFNRLLLIVIAAIAMIVGVVAAQGIRSAGVPAQSANAQPADDGADAARNKAKVEELAAGSAPRAAVATVALPPPATLPKVQAQVDSERRGRRAATHSGPKTSTCGRSKRRRWSQRFTAAARSRLEVRGKHQASHRSVRAIPT